MKRDLKVASDEQAVKLMLSFLVANMLDNELQVEDPKAEQPKYVVKYGWLSQAKDTKQKVGCPCYVAEYEGYIPGHTKAVKAILYVKSFAQRNPTMTKMRIVPDGNYDFVEIADGDIFKMDDGRKYLRKNGKVSVVE